MIKLSVLKKLNRLRQKRIRAALERKQADSMAAAYNIGYQGKRYRPFSAIGEDSEQSDIERSIRVFLIDHNNKVSAKEIDAAIEMFTPVIEEYIQGLKDGCREQGNDHVLDLCAPIKRLRAQYKSQQTDIEGSF